MIVIPELVLDESNTRQRREKYSLTAAGPTAVVACLPRPARGSFCAFPTATTLRLWLFSLMIREIILLKTRAVFFLEMPGSVTEKYVTLEQALAA